MANREYLPTSVPQSIGHPTPNDVHKHWRNSILVGPQTAGIPTVHNEDELGFENGVIGTDSNMQPRRSEDRTGGALAYHKSQRK